MKKMVMTAAALMLGTSALAWTPAEDAHLQALETQRADYSAEKSPLAFSGKGMMKAESVDASSWSAKTEEFGMTSLAKWSGDATVQTASASTEAKTADDDGIVIAEADFKSKDDVGGIQTAAVDMTQPTGMGGPIETGTGWPACSPGPGDDRCIQLYEPGVLPSFTAWKATDVSVAMGGPLEPAPAAAKPQATEHQGMDHGSVGSHADHDMSAKTATSDSEPAADTGDATAKPAATAGTAPGAIGGPVEQRTGYPPCRPGEGDDRCIQLYERGVTGRDN